MLTVSVAAHRELDVVGDGHFHHCRLVVDNLLDGQDDLVDIFPVDLLAVLETLNHVVDKLLRHEVALEASSVVVGVDSHVLEVQAFCGRGLIADLDGGKEGHLPHNLLALLELEACILVAGVELDALLEIVNGLLGAEDSCPGETATVVCLLLTDISVVEHAKAVSRSRVQP